MRSDSREAVLGAVSGLIVQGRGRAGVGWGAFPSLRHRRPPRAFPALFFFFPCSFHSDVSQLSQGVLDKAAGQIQLLPCLSEHNQHFRLVFQCLKHPSIKRGFILDSNCHKSTVPVVTCPGERRPWNFSSGAQPAWFSQDKHPGVLTWAGRELHLTLSYSGTGKGVSFCFGGFRFIHSFQFLTQLQTIEKRSMAKGRSSPNSRPAPSPGHLWNSRWDVPLSQLLTAPLL